MSSPFTLRQVAFIVLAAVIAGAAAFVAHRWLDRSGTGAPPTAVDAPERRPAFTLPNLEGEPTRITRWDGEVLLINFWATWCPPCRDEIPGFVELQQEYGDQGLQIVGIAIDEREAVRTFADQYLMNYPILIGNESAIEVGKRYGNRLGALPYSVIVDRQGRIVFAHRGKLSKSEAESHIRELL